MSGLSKILPLRSSITAVICSFSESLNMMVRPTTAVSANILMANLLLTTAASFASRHLVASPSFN